MQLKIPGEPQDLELAPALVPILAVGVSDIPGAVQCLDTGTIAYVTGRCVTTYSQENVSQVGVSELRREVRHITAVALSQDHKWMAVAEAMSNNLPPQVTLLDVANGMQRKLSLTGDKAEDYNCVAFSADGQLVIASCQLNNQPATLFQVWDWQASSQPTSSGTAQGFADKVSINPRFTSNVFIQTSADAFYMRLTSAGQYRPFPLEGITKHSDVQYIDHIWLADGRMALALSDRRLLLVDGVAVQHSVQLSGMPSSLAALPDGTVLAAIQKGNIDLLKPSSSAPGASLTVATTLKPPSHDDMGGMVALAGQTTIKCMSSDATGSRVSLYVKGGPIVVLNTQLLKSKAASSAAGGDQIWQQVMPAGHSGPIVSASLAMRRDYLATASEDLTVRVWCWRPPIRLVAVHTCHHSPLAVAIDPLGSEVVVTYVDCVRLYSVVEGMLLEVGALQLPTEPGKPAQELARCSLASWSPTGHLLAIAGGQGGRDILIFSPLHRTLVARLTGHFGSIQDMTWSSDGLYLASASEGAVLTWHMETFKRHQENTMKGCFNSAITCLPDFSTLAVGDSLQGIRLLDTHRSAAGRVVKPPTIIPGLIPASATTRLQSANTGRRAAGVINSSDIPSQGSNASMQSSLGNPASASETTYVNSAMAADTLIPAGAFAGIMQPARGSLKAAVTPLYRCCVGGGTRGCIRVCDLPPSSALMYQEYVPHTHDLTGLEVHYEGQIVISTDTDGFWMLHVLVAPQHCQPALTAEQATSPRRGTRSFTVRTTSNPDARTSPNSKVAAALAAAADSGALGRGAGMAALPSHAILCNLAKMVLGEARARQEHHTDVLTVRGSDVMLLKESVRELRDKLTKAASATEYKVYEKEQEVRRAVEADIARLRADYTALTVELSQSRAEAVEVAATAARNAELAAIQSENAIAKERERFESMIAVEIERTNKAEAEVSRLMSRFGKKLKNMQETHADEERSAQDKVMLLEMHVGAVQQQAMTTLEKAHAKMDQEVALDADLNDEEIVRMEAATKVSVEEHEARYMRLLAKHTLQGGLANQTMAANEKLTATNEQLTKENQRLSELAAALREELNAMHVAWADRDVKQRMTDMEVKELGHQVAQGRLYTQLATSRITELSSEIEPLKKGRSEALAQIAKLEALQVRQAERRFKDADAAEQLSSHLAQARTELAAVKAAAQQQSTYWDNFTTQLFRVLHTMPVDKWAGVLGRLRAEFVAGKDKLDWRKYNNDIPCESDMAAAKEMTESELRTQLREVHAQMLHSERLLESAHETRSKEAEMYKGMVARLQAENVDMLAQLNEARRDLRELHIQIDKLNADASCARATAACKSSPTRQRPSGFTSSPPRTAPLQQQPRHGGGFSTGNTGARTAAINNNLMNLTDADKPVSGVTYQQNDAAISMALIPQQGHRERAGTAPPRVHGSNSHQRPDAVTGDMPQGGWWLESNNMFEVPSNLNILKGPLPNSPTRPTTSQQGRATNEQQRACAQYKVSVPYKLRPGTADIACLSGTAGNSHELFRVSTGLNNSDDCQGPLAVSPRGCSPKSILQTPGVLQTAQSSSAKLVFSPPTTRFSQGSLSRGSDSASIVLQGEQKSVGSDAMAADESVVQPYTAQPEVCSSTTSSYHNSDQFNDGTQDRQESSSASLHTQNFVGQVETALECKRPETADLQPLTPGEQESSQKPKRPSTSSIATSSQVPTPRSTRSAVSSRNGTPHQSSRFSHSRSFNCHHDSSTVQIPEGKSDSRSNVNVQPNYSDDIINVDSEKQFAGIQDTSNCIGPSNNHTHMHGDGAQGEIAKQSDSLTGQAAVEARASLALRSVSLSPGYLTVLTGGVRSPTAGPRLTTLGAGFRSVPVKARSQKH